MSRRKPLVVVAHEDMAHRDAASGVLREVGMNTVALADGQSVLDLLAAAPVDALVVDVALQKPAFYRLCEHIRDQGLATKVLIISSVYSKTAYKRRATDLYGADDYVEQHHIADSLAQKIEALLQHGEEASFERGNRDEARDEAIRVAAERRLGYESVPNLSPGEAARRVATVIVSDMALYVAPELAEWNEGGCDAKRMPERLQAALLEARRLFAERIPENLALDDDEVLRALLAFMAKSE